MRLRDDQSKMSEGKTYRQEEKSSRKNPVPGKDHRKSEKHLSYRFVEKKKKVKSRLILQMQGYLEV